MKKIIAHSKHALMMTLVMAVLLGGLLPLVFTAISQILFPTASHGSIVMQNDKPIGSTLLGQEFNSPRYFWGRMSATTPPYNAAASSATASSATNFSMGNAMMLENANKRMAQFPAGQKIPLALITASGSGLDPHIPPASAYFQAARVAKERKLPLEQINALIATNVEQPYLGFIGTERVNVLALNLALDGIHAK